MSQVPGLHNEIANRLRCPVDWQLIMPGRSGLEVALAQQWVDIVQNHQIDDESSFVPDPEFEHGVNPILEMIDDPAELRIILERIDKWIAPAKDEYRSIVSPIARMKFVSQGIYAKHYPTSRLTQEEVREASRSGTSIFYVEFPPERIANLMWATFESVWRHILRQHNLKFIVDTMTSCGATFGNDTHYVLFDVDCSTPQTHAYPVPQPGKREMRKVLFYDDLQ